MANESTNIIKGVKARLSAQLTYLPYRDSTTRNVWILPDEDVPPDEVDFPLITIKESEILSTDYANPLIEKEMFMEITAYANTLNPEDSIIGNTVQSEKGVLELIDDIEDVLIDHHVYPDAEVLDYARPTESGPSQLFPASEDLFLQRKTITFRFVWEEYA